MTKRNTYTKEFKLEAVRFLESGDKSGADIARGLGIRRNMLYQWQAQLFDKGVNAFKGLGQKPVNKDDQLVQLELTEVGHRISVGRVERLMSHNSLAAKQGKKNKQRQHHRNGIAPVANILDRQFTAASPNTKWVSDITFIETGEGFLYLAVILDLYSRAIVGWSMSHKIDEVLVQDALTMAVDRRALKNGLLLHSDQGSQYKAKGYQQRIKSLNMICSMSRKGECHDNAVAESFFHSLKTELINDHVYQNRSVARQEIFKYIEIFYNRKRRHSTLHYQAPLNFEIMNAA